MLKTAGIKLAKDEIGRPMARVERRADGRRVLAVYVLERLGDGPMLGEIIGPKTLVEVTLSDDERVALRDALG